MPDGLYGIVTSNPDVMPDNLPAVTPRSYVKLERGYVFIMERQWDRVDFFVWRTHDEVKQLVESKQPLVDADSKINLIVTKEMLNEDVAVNSLDDVVEFEVLDLTYRQLAENGPLFSKLKNLQIVTETFIDMSENRPMFPVLFFETEKQGNKNDQVISLLVLSANASGLTVKAAECVNPSLLVLKTLTIYDVKLCKSTGVLDVSGKKVQKFQVCYDIDTTESRGRF